MNSQYISATRQFAGGCCFKLRQPPAVMIGPPFGARANAAMARSISSASRVLTGITSTLSDGGDAALT